MGFVILFAVGWVDYVTGYEIHLPALYFAPVAFLAWNVGLRAGLIMVVFATITWFLADRGRGHPYAAWYDGYLNASMEMIAYSVVAYTVARVRRELMVEKRLNAELSHALTEIKRLEGSSPSAPRAKGSARKTTVGSRSRCTSPSGRTPSSPTACARTARKKLFPGISAES